MKSSEALREAARQIESEEYDTGICVLLRINLDWNWSNEQRAITWLRKVAPRVCHNGKYWFGKPAREGGDQSHCITAACMAAAIAESEGD